MTLAYIKSDTMSVEFTAIGDEGYSLSSDVTSNQVEVGQDITDHVKNSPLSLVISGQITGEDAESKLKSLLSMRDARQIVRFVGRNRASNIVITGLNYKYSVAVGNGFEFDMSFNEIKVSSSKQIQISSIDPKVMARIKGTTKKGKKKKNTVPGSDYNVSDDM